MSTIAFILNDTICQESRVRLPKRSNVAVTYYIIAEISLLYNTHIINLFINEDYTKFYCSRTSDCSFSLFCNIVIY